MTRSSTSRRRSRDQAARIGEEIKLARVMLALAGKQAARRAGVATSTQTRVELGDPGVSIGTLCAVAEAVGVDIVLRAYPGKPLSLRDTGQLEIATLLRGQAHAVWQPSIEVMVGARGEAVDMVLFGPHEIWCVEIERMATDFQAQYRRAERKRDLLAAQHQRPVRLLLLVEDSSRNRAALERHRDLVRSALPAGSRDVLEALRSGGPLGRDGLLWIRRRAVRSRNIDRYAREVDGARGPVEISAS